MYLSLIFHDAIPSFTIHCYSKTPPWTLASSHPLNICKYSFTFVFIIYLKLILSLLVLIHKSLQGNFSFISSSIHTNRCSLMIKYLGNEYVFFKTFRIFNTLTAMPQAGHRGAAAVDPVLSSVFLTSLIAIVVPITYAYLSSLKTYLNNLIFKLSNKYIYYINPLLNK